MSDAGLQAVLVRPDFYIYGGIGQASELPQLLDALRRDLDAQAPQGGAVREQRRPLAAQA
ncbi:hypothetical protein D3C78_1619580 [compost metagenome]